ncbi:MAG: energy-dependent translational throttle protein EttA [Bdellovibrionota bacterium]|nr:energy-dependent translational throttle protein EttA [Pseudobdellovibrionaceae bacterium]
MANEIIYTMKGVGKVIPPKKYILKDIYLSYFYGAKIGILGGNGAGKSTLMKIMAGIDQDFLGEAFPARDLKIGYLQQEPELDEEKTVRENIEEALGELTTALKEFNEISMKFAEPMSDDEMNDLLEKQAKLQDIIDSQNGWELDHKLDKAMDALRCPPADTIVKNISGGEKRRVALTKLLLSEPDILLLDEPTNHLDAESVSWLEKYLHDFPGTVIAVTHDRYFLDNVAGWILELDRGEGIPFEGNYSSWLEQKEKRQATEAKQEDKRQKQISKELEWVRQGAKGRHAKAKARLSAYEELIKQPSKEKINELQMYIPPGPRLGNVVIEAKGVKKSFGDKMLYDNLDFMIPRGAIVGVIGPNGAGKTTMFNMITGREKPDEGEFTVGDTVQIAYVDQSRESLSGDKTVYEEVSGGDDIIMVGNVEMNARAYLSRFNFQGGDQQKKVGSLSGGERNRLLLAKLLKSGGNLLLLDEPTNDLDVATIRALEEALLNFAGSAVVVSHDRWFLDRICTHILAFEGDSQVTFYPGTYSEYEADLKKRLGVDSLEPTRIKYRKMH